MINRNDNPVEWSTLEYDLIDAREHIQTLLDRMQNDDYGEIEYQIDLKHIYSHINKAWNARNHIGDWSDSDFKKYSKYNSDIEDEI